MGAWFGGHAEAERCVCRWHRMYGKQSSWFDSLQWMKLVMCTVEFWVLRTVSEGTGFKLHDTTLRVVYKFCKRLANRPGGDERGTAATYDPELFKHVCKRVEQVSADAEAAEHVGTA